MTSATETEIPNWFAQAVAQEPQHHQVVAGSLRVSYRAWGNPALPGLVLVHGAGANSAWWDHIAPRIVTHHVVALDLSGHGDSDHHRAYEAGLWADEVAAVIEAASMHEPVVVGHSLGGRVAVRTAVEHPEAVSGVAFVDSPLNYQPSEEEPPYVQDRPHRVYSDPEDAVERFRTLPPQDVLLPYVRRHIARQSLRPVEGGWSWKFDPGIFRRRPPLEDELQRLARPAALLRCEHGMVDAGMAADMQRLVRSGLPVIELPDAGHHPMLDQPLVLVTALTTLLGVWPAG
jgi:pimeloyl-ACP methyl ester carboxylesterase